MKKTFKLYLAIFFLYLFASCNTASSSLELLEQAQKEVQTNPALAISILDSIGDPSNMGEDDYMKYIVVAVQAKYETTKDLSNDSIILQAQNYFVLKNDLQNAMLANFYAGNFYYDKQKWNESLVSFFGAKEYAKQLNDNLYMGRSQHNIGLLYFEQDLMDSAITHYQRAITYYNKVDNTDKYKLQVITSIGRSYDNLNNYDSAYYYFNKCLGKAQRVLNKEYIAKSKQNLGIVLREMGEYDRAVPYFSQALSETTNTEDSVKIYFSLAKLYTEKHQLDSASYYTNIAKDNVSKITSKGALVTLYGAVSDFYRETGSYEEALKYKELQSRATADILNNNGAVQLVSAEKKYKLRLEQEETAKLRMLIWLIIAITLFLAVLIYVVHYFRNRHIKQQQKLIEEKNKLLETENKLLEERLDNYEFMQNVYGDIVNEWSRLENEIRTATENMYDKDLLVFGKVRLWMNHLSSIINLKFVFSAKDYLSRIPNGDKALEILDDEDLLLYMLLYNEYADDEVSHIMGEEMLLHKSFIDRKTELKAKLEKVGLKMPH